MRPMDKQQIPNEAIKALKIIQELLDGTLVAVYLYGSAVMGGLRPNSDVDILVLTDQDLLEKARKDPVGRLMTVSGKVGYKQAVRSLEVTVINRNNISRRAD